MGNTLNMINFNVDSIIKQEHMKFKLQVFTNLLIKWAKVHNLTGSNNLDSITNQIQDSLMPISFLKPFKICIDIGSGAGFPALMLACHYSQSKFYLLEPRAKRVAFLENAVIQMELDNVIIIQDFSYNVSDIKADLITSRAVCQSYKLMQDSQHLISLNGYYLLFKGSNTISEIDGLPNTTTIFKNNQRLYAYIANNTNIILQ